ncbi:MAG: penicillin-binding transpeptidase domain-containing protein, partial [Bacteroidales bacterium]|nr:penicillin-binding transpeptidase domain-containing protein [Bacteroidales bacterium]
YSYEAILRGRKGVRKQLRDRYNRIKGSYMDGKYDVEARAGEDLYTSIDVELQLLGESLMQNKIGSIVAIEPSTGEILALVTSPTYDPNLLTGRQRNKMYAQLLLDDLNPLMHRALQGTYPPGSTFKVVNALIGEQMGVLYPEKKYSCAGAFRLGGLTVGCHSHYSPLNLAGSIQHSCNTYYCWAFRDMIDKNNFPDTRTGFNEWRRQVVSFGFGSSFVSDLPYMNPGTIPYAENYDNQHGKNRWSALSIISLAIGQGEITVTPVHLANLCAIIANKGYYYMPHIVKAVGAPEHLLQKYAPIHTAIDPAYFDVIIEGMHLVTIAGTATNARIDSIEVCGKTGTAQNPHGENHSLFIAFAPKEGPKIAIAVVVENAGYGSTWAAPIASLMMEKYLKGAVKREYLIKYIENTTLLHKRKKKI